MKTKLFLPLILTALLCGCVTTERLEPGGAYSATETSAAMPELFALDASFDLAYSGLDTTFKYERNNRAVLWSISPNIKHALDKLRVQASIVNADYALARKTYLASPTPANLAPLQTSLSKLQKANAAALTVIQTKGQ